MASSSFRQRPGAALLAPGSRWAAAGCGAGAASGLTGLVPLSPDGFPVAPV
jgi:hypothetical protein